jgi:hypothetical protein
MTFRFEPKAIIPNHVHEMVIIFRNSVGTGRDLSLLGIESHFFIGQKPSRVRRFSMTSPASLSEA